MNYRPVLNNIPPVVKNLIIINVIFLLATWVVRSMGIDLVEILGMHYPGSEKFMLHQIFTHMFMHGGLTHLFFNMFALYMLSLIHISEPTRRTPISYAVFCLKKKKKSQ